MRHPPPKHFLPFCSSSIGGGGLSSQDRWGADQRFPSSDLKEKKDVAVQKLTAVLSARQMPPGAELSRSRLDIRNWNLLISRPTELPEPEPEPTPESRLPPCFCPVKKEGNSNYDDQSIWWLGRDYSCSTDQRNITLSNESNGTHKKGKKIHQLRDRRKEKDGYRSVSFSSTNRYSRRFFSFFFSKSNYTLAATVCQHTNEHLLLLSFYRSLGEGGRHRFPPLAQLVAFRGDRIGGGARRRPASRRWLTTDPRQIAERHVDQRFATAGGSARPRAAVGTDPTCNVKSLHLKKKRRQNSNRPRSTRVARCTIAVGGGGGLLSGAKTPTHKRRRTHPFLPPSPTAHKMAPAVAFDSTMTLSLSLCVSVLEGETAAAADCESQSTKSFVLGRDDDYRPLRGRK